jgi:hypothetical protein
LKITDALAFKKHLDSWVGKLPLGFHSFVRAEKDNDIEKILEHFKKKEKSNFEQYGVDEEFVRNYIMKVKENYHAI